MNDFLALRLYSFLTKTLFMVVMMTTNTFAQDTSSTQKIQFPKDFQWGVATAGHQVEGDNVYSDWWAWEQIPGKILNGDKSGKASFHIDRMEEDVEIMKSLHTDTYRFSIEWSRIEPREGEFDASGVAVYRRLFDLLKKAGIKPMVTLHHFVQPQWFTASGGWRRGDSPEIFERYVNKVISEFGADSEYWITFNEPNVLLLGGYCAGLMPPGEKRCDIWTATINILKSHARAYRALHAQAKEQGRQIKVGIAYHFRPILTPHSFLKKAISIFDFQLNWNIPTALQTGRLVGFQWKGWKGLSIPWKATAQLDEVIGTQDFIGVNYYTREVVSLSWKSPFLLRTPVDGLEGSDLNWGLDPVGFYEVLKMNHDLFPNLPFMITENGLADGKDQWRAEYVRSHLVELHRFMKDYPSNKVEAYYYWSLLDNFEWQEGFWPRFGLFEVDYDNHGARIERPSAKVVREIFRTNEVSL